MLDTTNNIELATYKIRKSGNSDVITIPQKIKDVLGVVQGDSLSYLLNSEGAVVIEKQQEEIDIDKVIQQSMNQYKDLLSEWALL